MFAMGARRARLPCQPLWLACPPCCCRWYNSYAAPALETALRLYNVAPSVVVLHPPVEVRLLAVAAPNMDHSAACAAAEIWQTFPAGDCC